MMVFMTKTMTEAQIKTAARRGGSQGEGPPRQGAARGGRGAGEGGGGERGGDAEDGGGGVSLRVSHTGSTHAWTGMILDGKREVWRCPHSHRNRDYDDYSPIKAARQCAAGVLEAMESPDKVKRTMEAMANSRGWFATEWRAQAHRAHQEWLAWTLEVAGKIGRAA